MSTNRLFAQPSQDFTTALMSDINAYIEKYKDHFFRKTGVARAKELQAFIMWQLVEQEELTTIQLMWRLFSYIKMGMRAGKLGTSTELRNVMLDRLCKSLSVNKDALESTLKHMYAIEMDTLSAVARTGATYHIDHNALQLKAKLMHAESQLVEKGNAAPVVSSELKDILLNAIDGYRDEVNSVWYKRVFKQTGLQRAEKLARFISDQLVGKECLNDDQLCARVVEMARMYIGEGEGMLGTSKDLRIALLKGICSWKRLNLNLRAMSEEIAAREEPIIAGGSFVAYIPDGVAINVEVRSRNIMNALKKQQVQNVIPAELADRNPREIAFGH